MISSKKHRYYKCHNDIKVGDVVTVRSKEWYDENRTGRIVTAKKSRSVFDNYMARFCGCIMEVVRVDMPDEHGEFFYPTVITKEVPGFAFEPWMFEEFEFPKN